ncbi:MAG: hypothetical protein P8Q37_02110 [Porticoccaceae bacterium]|nr:hypothetical protein [Porticoccaceae bacterium]MDG1473667.1 hypothetical protein [Porticoccaceae bacterium]
MLHRKVVILIIALVSLGVLGLSVFWLSNNDDAEEDAIYNNVPLSINTEDLQQKVRDKLSQQIDKQIQKDSKVPVDDTLSTMRTKLTALIKSLGNRQPSEEELVNFFEKRKVYYGGGAKVEFLYRPFLSARHGGQAFDVAEKALQEMVAYGVPLLKDHRLPDDGYFFGLYKPGEDETIESRRLGQAFGPDFKSKLIDLITEDQNQLPCWGGPITGIHGAYLVCVKAHEVLPFANLEDIREEVINDWRLSTVRKN